MRERIEAEITRWLLDADEPLVTMFAAAQGAVGPFLSLAEFLNVIDACVADGTIVLLEYVWPRGPLVEHAAVPRDLVRRYEAVGIPNPPDYDPLGFYLRLPDSMRAPRPWHLHDDLESMTFELRVRDGDPASILAGVAPLRPDVRRVVRGEHRDGDTRVVVGDLVRPSN